jgi:hypothetical protein
MLLSKDFKQDTCRPVVPEVKGKKLNGKPFAFAAHAVEGR